MYLREVEVENFRNLKSFKVGFHHGLNLIVGRNGTGKSNLFRAIRHALGPASSYADMPWLVPDDRYHNGPEATEDPIRISLTFAGLSEHERVLYFDILEFDSESPEDSLARIHFEAPWDPDRDRFLPRRWGGSFDGDRSEVPPEVLQSIPLTFLPALRDAESALSPGRSSRLAKLLENVSRTEPEEDHESTVVEIFKTANEDLASHPLVREVEKRLSENADSMAGADFVRPSIAASPPQFDRVLKGLRVLLPTNPIDELGSAGLGYNNLLFIATVLAHLRESPEGDTPLLLIEEPEAHLHPQLVSRLGEFLSGQLGETRPPQTLVTSHSPLLASQTAPSQTSVFFASDEDSSIHCNSLRDIGMSSSEELKLRRMLDITRATMYFARGLILVEGISEELLLPQLADLMDTDLSKNQVSVIPICGVSFDTIARVLGPTGLGVRVSILTDGDPAVVRGKEWKEDTPQRNPSGAFAVSERTTALTAQFSEHPSIRSFNSDVTLEYDLARACRENARTMAQVWKDLYSKSTVLGTEMIDNAATDAEAALSVWRGLCRSSTSGSKAEFAHALAHRIAESRAGDFQVPAYIEQAVRWVLPPEEAS